MGKKSPASVKQNIEVFREKLKPDTVRSLLKPIVEERVGPKNEITAVTVRHLHNDVFSCHLKYTGS